jgi:hypothetical protein
MNTNRRYQLSTDFGPLSPPPPNESTSCGVGSGSQNPSAISEGSVPCGAGDRGRFLEIRKTRAQNPHPQHDASAFHTAYLVAHNEGPSGEGFRIVDDSGTTIEVDDKLGSIESSVTAKARHGDTGHERTCQVLLQRLNQDGCHWVDFEVLKRRDTDVDCKFYESFTSEMHALHPAKRRMVKFQDLQITRAIWDQTIWNDVNRGGADFTLGYHEAAEELWLAMDRKKHAGRRDLILALDALQTPGLAMMPVVAEFRKQYSVCARSLGFQSIWLVGPTSETTFRMDLTDSGAKLGL